MNLLRLPGLGILALLALAGPTAGLVRADQLTKEELRTSSWDTHYTVSGQRVHATVTFNGPSGSYDLLDDNGNVLATGDLSHLHYDVNPANGAFAIAGHWALNGESGSLFFSSIHGNPLRFRGHWTNPAQHGRGPWNGVYSSLP